ncbi:pilus assembly protein TadG-related protein [Vibrio sp. S4M6]|uniref:pilus assembly protein TadG-related protein n=1 Tax=Vibrio sinus TaxID=2946865 RepID=UPI00202A1822|nr:pilus assembly protein TadG-related protein [Vibrio sinus]MCL9781416.1 pilus assembly protein TadG-related protein [Vibrio sinus]
MAVGKGRTKSRGLVTVMTTMAMLLLVAMAGMALDTGNTLARYRDAQTAADAAALAGAYELFYGNTGSINSSATTAASTNGYVDGVDGVSITINSPPTSGIYNGDASSVEVIIDHQMPTSFLSTIGFTNLDYQVRAVANGNVGSSRNCVYVLGSSGENSLQVASSSSLDTNCGIYVNSDNSDSLAVESGSCLSGTSITTVGGHTGAGSGSCSGGSNFECSDGTLACPYTGDGASAGEEPIPVQDPLSGLTPPTVTYTAASCPPDETCDASGCSGKEKDSGGPYEPYTVDTSGSETLNPGTYCGGILVKKGNVTLNPGVYILRGGGLRVEGGDSNVTGADVSFYNTCFWQCDDSDPDHDPEKGPEWYWTMDINSSATVNLAAPACNGGASGQECANDLDGILFFSDRLAPETDNPGDYPTNRIDSSVDATLEGAIYVWNQHLKFHSGSGGSTSQTILISKFLEVTSGSNVSIDNFTGAGQSSPIKRVTLVE